MKNFTRKRILLACCFQLVFITAFTQVSVVSGGNGQTNVSPQNASNGDDASGLGCGGGGANFQGGNGGNGMYGGGGGGAAGHTAKNMIGGSGGKGVVVVAFYSGASFVKAVVCDNSTSITVGTLITAVKVWAIGAGGGGAGATDIEATCGGGGGAGGIAYITKAVATGDIITYTLGASGAGGIDANDGNSGGTTSATIGGTTITAYGGSGGKYNSNTFANGGSYSGGDGGCNGGQGTSVAGDAGGGGGGGIGASTWDTNFNGDGSNGANAADVSGLFNALLVGKLLPIKWENFTVTPSLNNSALLQWKTSYELNTVSFTVQYSTDGIHYKDISVIPASGNSTSIKTYAYVHQDPLPGITYYRLLQIDNNNKGTFSSVVKYTLYLSKDKEFILLSNKIVNNSIAVQMNKSTSLTLLSMDGKVFYNKQLDKGWQYIDATNLAKGYYVLRSANETQKILIQ